jgi:hypothetical protein
VRSCTYREVRSRSGSRLKMNQRSRWKWVWESKKRRRISILRYVTPPFAKPSKDESHKKPVPLFYRIESTDLIEHPTEIHMDDPTMPPSEPFYMSRSPLSPLSLSSLSLSVPVGGSLVLQISISIPNKPVLHKQVQHGQAPRPARQTE